MTGVAAMADEALLSGSCVVPKKLTSLGYRFAFEDLERALRNAIGEPNSRGGAP